MQAVIAPLLEVDEDAVSIVAEQAVLKVVVDDECIKVAIEILPCILEETNDHFVLFTIGKGLQPDERQGIF